MKCFKAQQRSELKSYMYHHCNVHDGMLEKAVYNDLLKTFTIRIINPYWEEVYEIIFLEVAFYLQIGDNPWGNNQTINALCVEEKYQELDPFVKWDSDVFQSKMCFLIEQFSGNRTYIICSEVQFL